MRADLWTILSFSLRCFFLFGSRPYAGTDSEKEGESLTNDDGSKSYLTSSKRMMSRFCPSILKFIVCIIFSIYFMLAFAEFFYTNDKYSSETLRQAMKMNKIIDTGVMMLLFLYVQFSGKSLKKCVDSLKRVMKDLGEVKAISTKFFLPFLVVIFCALFIGVVHMQTFLRKYEWVQIVVAINVIAFMTLKLTFSCFYWASIRIIAMAYRSIHDNILKEFKIATSQTSNREALKISKSSKIQVNETHLIARTNQIEPQIELAQENSSSGLKRQLSSSYGKILELYRVRKQVQTYASPAIVLIILYMICTAIIGFFMCYHMECLPIQVKVLVLVYICMTTTTVCFILEVPGILCKQVRLVHSHFRFVI